MAGRREEGGRRLFRWLEQQKYLTGKELCHDHKYQKLVLTPVQFGVWRLRGLRWRSEAGRGERRYTWLGGRWLSIRYTVVNT